MNTVLRNCIVTLMIPLVAAPLAAAPVGTTITYQGKLINNGSPVSEATSMAFSLWDDPTAGTQQGATLPFDGAGANPAPVSVADGLFTVQLDFGVNPYADNSARWLEISINGTPLLPRQPLSAAPFALNTRGLAVDGSDRVGIGTPTPGAVISNSKLDVVGGHVAVSNNYGLLSMNAAGTGIGAGMDTTVADELEFYTNGARRVHIDAAGKVGIGTTNPTSPLSFRNVDERKITYWESGAPNGLYGVDMAVGGNVRHYAGMIGKFLIGHDDGAGGFIERMRVHSNGNVGIGTSSPNSPLHISSASSQAPLFINDTFSTPNTQSWGIWSQTTNPRGTAVFGTTSADGNPVGVQGNTHAPDGLGVAGYALSATGPGIGVRGFTSSPSGYAGHFTGRCYVSGNVGIGTTTPAQELHIKASSGNADIRLEEPGGVDWDIAVVSADGGLHFAEAGVGPNMSILPGGNVGIGTTAPTAPLHIASSNAQKPLLVQDTFATPDTESWGIWSETSNPKGTAVFGRAFSPSGEGVGVKGITVGSNGVGVEGYAAHRIGGGIGVLGRARSRSGYAGYFAGRCYISRSLGIGTETPAARLDVQGGDAHFSDRIGIGTDNPTSPLSFRNVDERKITYWESGAPNGFYGVDMAVGGNVRHFAGMIGNFLVGHDDGAGGFNERLRVHSNGYVGIGTTVPTQALDVVGNIRATGSVFASCGTLSCSDERFKTNIEPVADALGVVEQLQPVHYDWKRDEFPDRHFNKDRQVGLIAQDVQKVAPEVVRQDDEGYLAVDYGRLTPLIVSAIKQVKSEKDDQIASLHAENAVLKARLDRLESMLGKAAK